MEQNSQPSYWESILLGALIVAIITSIVGTGLSYYISGAEPSMSMMITAGLFVPLTCLFGAFGGFVSNRHYAKNFDITFPIGKGALIGFYTGVIAAIFMTILSLIWTKIIDPSLMDNFANNMIAAFEQMDMPEAQKEQSINDMVANFERQNSVGGILKIGRAHV